MERVAFLGLGAMGARMVLNLMKSGYLVTVWNRTQDRAMPLIEAGASWGDSPRQAAEEADFVIAMVRDDEASQSVWLDDQNGAFLGMQSTAIAIDSSTLSIEWTQTLATSANALNIEFLEAPVSGSRPHAEAGNLVYFVAGEQSTFKRSKKLLNCMGSSIHYSNNVGTGAMTKLFTNTLLGIQVATLAELFGILKKQNVNPAEIIKAVSSTSSWSPLASWVSSSMIDQDYRPMFTIDLIGKDLGYALDATEGRSGAPVIEAAMKQFEAAIERDMGHLNMSAVAELYS